MAKSRARQLSLFGSELNVAANGNIAIANTTSTIAAKLHIEDPAAQAANNPVLVIGNPGGSDPAGVATGILVDASTNYGFVHKQHSATNSGIGYLVSRSRGTASAETVVDDDDNLGYFVTRGYNGTAYSTTGYIGFTVDETVRPISGTNIPTEYFLVLNDGTTYVQPIGCVPSATPGTVKTTIAGILDVTGTGITLPNAGTQTTGTADSDVLDWYEEGTFTPYWSDNTGAAPTSITYNYQKGFYQRVGNTVHFWMQMQRTAWDFTNLSGTVRIWGLPFAVASTGNFASTFPSCSVSFSSDSSSSAHVAQQAEIVWGTSSIALIYFNGAPPGTRSGTLNFANIDVGPISSSATSIYLDGMYTIA